MAPSKMNSNSQAGLLGCEAKAELILEFIVKLDGGAYGACVS
jgi:hypothetical protein